MDHFAGYTGPDAQGSHVSSPPPHAAQRSDRRRRPVHRPPPRYRPAALPDGPRTRRRAAPADRRRAGRRGARPGVARVPDAVGAAARGLAVDRVADRLPRRLDHPGAGGDVPRDDRHAHDHARDRDAAGPCLADPPPRGRARAAGGRAAADLRRHRDRGARAVLSLVLDHRGPGADAGPPLMRRFLGYYRQFEELSPEEVSRDLRRRRDEEKAQSLTETPALDLSSPAWHEPPHAEIVNAATFALRRAVNAYPDAGAEALSAALAARHGVEPAQVVAGHGAGELLRAACQALLAGAGSEGEIALAWPGWGPLPRIVHEAGGRPVPVPLGRDGAADVKALAAAAGAGGAGLRAVALCSPNDPTGGTVGADDVRRLASALPAGTWILLDAALADFEEPGSDLAALTAELDRLLVFRTFSKAHAMAGFRAGYAVGPEGGSELLGRLAPVLGVSAPAQAGMTWAVANGERYLPRRRELAAAEREHLAAMLAGTDLAFPPGTGPLLWLSSASLSGKDLAAGLAASRIFVTPGSAWGDDRHVRVALRGPAATDPLAAALRYLTAGACRGTRP